MTKIEVTPKNVLAKFQEVPLSEIPTEVFLANTDPLTYRVIHSRYDILVASTTWKDPEGKRVCVTVLHEAPAFYGKALVLDFHIGWGDLSTNLLEAISRNCAEAGIWPNSPNLSIKTMPEETGIWSAVEGMGYRYAATFNFPPTRDVHMGPNATTWLTQRALEACQLAETVAVRKKY